MSATEKFCLRWNDFESNISVAFRELREEKDFFDVTLSVGPGHQHIQAHKLILSACSPFFRGVLKQNQHAHPLLYLKGVGFSELQAVLNFMYHGEVNVAQEELNTFLAVAEELQVKGLTQGGGGSNPNPSSKPKSDPPPQRPRPPEPSRAPAPAPRPRPTAPPTSSAPFVPPPSHSDIADDDIQEVMPIKTELPSSYQPTAPAATPHHQGTVASMEEEQYGEEGYEDYGGYEGGEGYGDGSMLEGDQNKGIKDFVIRKEGLESGFICAICNTAFSMQSNCRRHVKEKHFGLNQLLCPFCNQPFLKRHIQGHISTCKGAVLAVTDPC
jgi:hypothetical protein